MVSSQIHGAKDKYSCDVCSKKFKYRNAFQRHARLHDEEKQFPCPTCGKRFPYRTTLKRHLEITCRGAGGDHEKQRVAQSGRESPPPHVLPREEEAANGEREQREREAERELAIIEQLERNGRAVLEDGNVLILVNDTVAELIPPGRPAVKQSEARSVARTRENDVVGRRVPEGTAGPTGHEDLNLPLEISDCYLVENEAGEQSLVISVHPDVVYVEQQPVHPQPDAFEARPELTHRPSPPLPPRTLAQNSPKPKTAVKRRIVIERKENADQKPSEEAVASWVPGKSSSLGKEPPVRPVSPQRPVRRFSIFMDHKWSFKALILQERFLTKVRDHHWQTWTSVQCESWWVNNLTNWIHW